MNTAVAVTSEICRTVLYLGAIAAFVKVAPHFLPRAAIAGPTYPPQPPAAPIPVPALDGQQRGESTP